MRLAGFYSVWASITDEPGSVFDCYSFTDPGPVSKIRAAKVGVLRDIQKTLSFV
jgi:hypothetical protein